MQGGCRALRGYSGLLDFYSTWRSVWGNVLLTKLKCVSLNIAETFSKTQPEIILGSPFFFFFAPDVSKRVWLNFHLEVHPRTGQEIAD